MYSNVMEKTGVGSDNRGRVCKCVAVILGLTAILIAVPFAAVDGGAPAKKPQVPIALQFGTEGPVAVGSAVTVTLTVTPMTSSESVTVSIALPDGLSLLDGDTSWTGSLEKDQSHVLTIQVRPENAALLEVRAKAVLLSVGGSRMSRNAVLTLDLDPNKPKPRLQQRSGPGRDSITEIPAQSRIETR
jgi:hypothetical protein